MKSIAINALTKTYSAGAAPAVDRLDLDVAPGEFLTLLGPSGCGKTTTLRCIAGLEAPTHGSVRIGDQLIAAPADGVFVPPERRGVGMVFQSYALWPHMSVFGNVAYPLKMARTPRAEIGRAVDEALTRVGLGGLHTKNVSALSGGQQQRVALARAMVGRPDVMLYDEPLSNLDAKLRFAMRDHIRSVHNSLGTTSVYVTHDQEEAVALSDRIIVMRAGRIEQVDTPRDLYTRPKSTFVADFMGFQNILPATVESRDGDHCHVRLDHCPDVVRSAYPAPADGRVSVAFRAQHLRFSQPDARCMAVNGVVTKATDWGSALRLQIDVGGHVVKAIVDEEQLVSQSLSMRPGDPVTFYVRPEHVIVLASRRDDHDDAGLEQAGEGA